MNSLIISEFKSISLTNLIESHILIKKNKDADNNKFYKDLSTYKDLII